MKRIEMIIYAAVIAVLNVPLVWGGSYWGTPIAVAADQALFGGYPTVMVQALYSDWLDELMAAGEVEVRFNWTFLTSGDSREPCGIGPVDVRATSTIASGSTIDTELGSMRPCRLKLTT